METGSHTTASATIYLFDLLAFYLSLGGDFAAGGGAVTDGILHG